MSKKSGKIAEIIAGCQGQPQDAHYLGYFACFNSGHFYEAHDVLEELWLRDRHGPHGNFYKGLIQLAGAFVHLQKDRLKPAAALFRLSGKYLSGYSEIHEHLDLRFIRQLIGEWLGELEKNGCTENPWHRRKPPQVCLGPVTGITAERVS